jgi:hypothetical protein
MTPLLAAAAWRGGYGGLALGAAPLFISLLHAGYIRRSQSSLVGLRDYGVMKAFMCV